MTRVRSALSDTVPPRVVEVTERILIESMLDSLGPGLSFRMTSNGVGVPVRPMTLNRALLPVSSTAIGPSLTGVTLMVKFASVERAGEPLSVPRTMKLTGPKKFAAGMNLSDPFGRIVATPSEAKGVVTSESVTV